MQFDLVRSLARLRIERMTCDAATYRTLVRSQRARDGVRHRLARAVRAFGYAAVSLGDALAQPH